MSGDGHWDVDKFMDIICLIIKDGALFKAIANRPILPIAVICEKCGAVICDAMKLVKELDNFISEISDKMKMKGDFAKLMSEIYNDEEIEDAYDGEAIDKMEALEDGVRTVMENIIKFPSFEEWIECDEETERRACDFITDYEYPAYIICERVCLMRKKSCDCFKEIKEGTCINV